MRICLRFLKRWTALWHNHAMWSRTNLVTGFTARRTLPTGQTAPLVQKPVRYFRLNDRKLNDLMGVIPRQVRKPRMATGTRIGKERDCCGRFQQHLRMPRMAGLPPGLRRSAAGMRRWRFWAGESVDGGRLELEEFWCP